jgi:hypothetical protein
MESVLPRALSQGGAMPSQFSAGAAAAAASLAAPPAAPRRRRAASCPLAPPARRRRGAPSVPSVFSHSKQYAIQVEEFAHDPELEEASIRFANGDDEGAEAGLLEVLGPQGSRVNHDETWLTLFDLYRATGSRTASRRGDRVRRPLRPLRAAVVLDARRSWAA